MKVAFLRGINVSGKNKIKMSDLKELFEALGAKNIKTYLNTGNVVFDGELSSLAIEEAIASQMGLNVFVLIKDYESIEKIIGVMMKLNQEENFYVTMFSEPYDDITSIVEEKKHEDDTCVFGEDFLLLHIPNGYGKSKLTNRFLEKKTGLIATTRNFKTMIQVKALMKK